MIGVKNQKDPCDGVHHGGLMMKIICWCILVIFMFFLPNWIISFYGTSHYSSLHSYVTWLATFAFNGLLFHFFTPSRHDCDFDTVFIVMTLIFTFIFAVVTPHPSVSGSIFPASVLSLYCTYLCYSALASEPRDYECNGLHYSQAVSTGTLTVGLLTTVFSVVYSDVRVGSSTTLLSPPSSPRAAHQRPFNRRRL